MQFFFSIIHQNALLFYYPCVLTKIVQWQTAVCRVVIDYRDVNRDGVCLKYTKTFIVLIAYIRKGTKSYVFFCLK